VKQAAQQTVSATEWLKLFERAIMRVPSRFAQLILLARLSAAPSVHTCLPVRSLPRIRNAEELIHATHVKIFRAWLCSPIEERSRDFLAYCTTLGVTRSLAQERFLQFCRDIVPFNAANADLKMFLADVELFASRLPADYPPSRLR
jgi:hypothetical protein